MISPYSPEFYEYQSQGSLRSAEEVVPIVLEFIRPGSVIDIGCGVGTWLSVFKRHGVPEVLGIDGTYVDTRILRISASEFLPRDVSQKVHVHRKFDLAMSLEVAEHLDAPAAPRFVESLTALAPVVLFSAAIPHQGGAHHVNEQWPDYWEEHFRRHGFVAYPADGFTVVRGAAAQRERLDKKKLWNNYYYALADGDKSFQQEGGYFAWLERMGIYKSYGAYPGLKSEFQPKWEEAKRRGIVLFADTSGDSPWLNDKPTDGRKFIETVAPYTRFFKATNEIDIRGQGEWQKLRKPQHWLERAKWEYEAVHKTRPDGHYAGGSLVRPGDMGGNQGYADGLGPGMWFTKVLGLGLDKYQDAWDVHAYPQHPPRFAGPIGNSANEDERGVLAAYARLGRKNTLPFWLGETGAKAAHGHTGRRWQAEETAKMIAWVNSRSDYLGIAFCIGHEYDWGYGRLWDYSMGHKPGEAGLYTAAPSSTACPTGAYKPAAARFRRLISATHS